MNVEFQGSTVSFDDLPLGGFFMSELNRGGGGTFGLCVSSADGKKGAVILLPRSSQEGASLETSHRLTNGTFIHFAGAAIRPDLASITAGEVGSPFGALISVNAHYYIRAQEGRNGHFRTFNIQSGRYEDPQGAGTAFHFARWKAGLTVDQKFEPIYCFPATSP
jgi:hypothetical protein